MMKTIYRWMCAAVLVAGCGGDGDATATGGSGGPGEDGVGGAAATGGRGASGGNGGSPGTGASGGEPLPVVLDPVPGEPAFAVVSTDFFSSAVGLLDADGAILFDDWLTSGSAWPQLVAALSGDVVLPTRQQGDGTLVVIDRLMTDVVSRFEMATGGLHGQVRTHGSSDVAAFSSNPQDCVFVDEESAWISRYEPSVVPNPAPDVAGNDLYEINPTTMTLTDRRIDLAPFNEEIEGEEIFARPARMVRLGNYLAVGLDGLSLFFNAGMPGKLAIVDLTTREVTELPLGAVANCGSVLPIPNVDDQVVVACTGVSASFDPVEQRATSGVFVVRIDEEGDPSIVRSWFPQGDPGAATTVGGVVALSDREVIAVAAGDFVSVTDAAYVLDIETGDQTLLFDIPGSFEIGEGAYDVDAGLLLIPVSSEGVRVYRQTDSGFQLAGTTVVSSPPLGPVIVSSLR